MHKLSSFNLDFVDNSPGDWRSLFYLHICLGTRHGFSETLLVYSSYNSDRAMTRTKTKILLLSYYCQDSGHFEGGNR